MVSLNLHSSSIDGGTVCNKIQWHTFLFLFFYLCIIYLRRGQILGRKGNWPFILKERGSQPKFGCVNLQCDKFGRVKVVKCQVNGSVVVVPYELGVLGR